MPSLQDLPPELLLLIVDCLFDFAQGASATDAGRAAFDSLRLVDRRTYAILRLVQDWYGRVDMTRSDGRRLLTHTLARPLHRPSPVRAVRLAASSLAFRGEYDRDSRNARAEQFVPNAAGWSAILQHGAVYRNDAAQAEAILLGLSDPRNGLLHHWRQTQSLLELTLRHFRALQQLDLVGLTRFSPQYRGHLRRRRGPSVRLAALRITEEEPPRQRGARYHLHDLASLFVLPSLRVLELRGVMLHPQPQRDARFYGVQQALVPLIAASPRLTHLTLVSENTEPDMWLSAAGEQRPELGDDLRPLVPIITRRGPTLERLTLQVTRRLNRVVRPPPHPTLWNRHGERLHWLAHMVALRHAALPDYLCIDAAGGRQCPIPPQLETLTIQCRYSGGLVGALQQLATFHRNGATARLRAVHIISPEHTRLRECLEASLVQAGLDCTFVHYDAAEGSGNSRSI